MATTKAYTLNNGKTIPALGLGKDKEKI